MAVARRDEGGLKPLRMEVEQSRKRFLSDISGFQMLLEQSVTQRRRFSRTKCNAAPAVLEQSVTQRSRF